MPWVPFLHKTDRLHDSESNNIARMRNRKAARFDDRLAPLFAISTNEKIENFPQTLGDIDKLDGKTAVLKSFAERLCTKRLY